MKKILLLDDNPEFVEVIKIRLEANNYSVSATSDSQDFFQISEKEKPDLIILDIIMPGVDGYQICEQLRKEKSTANIPIILLTGKELEPSGINDRCLKLGIEGFLLKPIDAKDLLAKIDEVLGTK